MENSKNQIDLQAIKTKYGLSDLSDEQVNELMQQLNQFVDILLAVDPPNENL